MKQDKAYRMSLSLCEEMIAFGWHVVGAKPAIKGDRFRCAPGRKVSKLEVALALAAIGWGVKLVQSIVTLCKRGCGDEACVLVRSLFEAYLATQFLLKPKLQINNKNVSRKMRARIYRAAPLYARLNRFNQWKNIAGLKQCVKAFGSYAKLLADVATADKRLGQTWGPVYKNHTSFRGMKVGALARQVGESTDYISIYAVLSDTVHAGDMHRHVNLDTLEVAMRPRWDMASIALHMAASILRSILLVENKQLGLGFDKRLAEFKTKLKARDKVRRPIRRAEIAGKT